MIFIPFRFCLSTHEVEELYEILKHYGIEYTSLSLLKFDNSTDTDSITADVLCKSLTLNNVVIALIYSIAGPFFKYSSTYPIWRYVYTLNSDWASLICIMFNTLPTKETLNNGTTKI